MKKIINIPYYSQHDDVLDDYWKPIACGAVSVKMVFDFLQKKDEKLSVNNFVLLANQKGAHGEHGWVHQGLVDVVKDLGYFLKRKEFKSQNISDSDRLLNEGIQEILLSIDNEKPVIISAVKKFSEEKKFHMVVLVGYEKDDTGEIKGFYYNDSDYRNQEGKNLFVDLEIFKKYWRRLAIFID